MQHITHCFNPIRPAQDDIKTAWRGLLRNPASETFQSFHALTSEWLVSYCTRIIPHSEVVHDVVQQAYLKLWHTVTGGGHTQLLAGGKVATNGPLGHWRDRPILISTYDPLGALLRFATLELGRCRKEYRRELERRVEVEFAYDMADPAPPATEKLFADENVTRIQEALEQLQSEDRLAFEMYYHQERTHREIASALKMERSTVTRRISRAARKVRAAVSGTDNEVREAAV